MMDDACDYDVLIAGGGLVGASLAVALQGSGLRVAVVEPVSPRDSRQPSFDDRQTALAPTSRRFFLNLGLWESLAGGVEPIRRIHVSDRGHGGFTRLDAEEEGLPALGHVAPNRLLGAVLGPAMRQAADVFCPAEIRDTSVVLTEDGVAGDTPGAGADPSPRGAAGAGGAGSATATGTATADTHSVARHVVIETEDGTRTVSTRLLVVADGMGSRTRDALGVGLDERDYGQSAIIANLRTRRPHQGTAYERFTPEGPLALLPVANAMSLVWTLPHDEANAVATEWSDQDFLARLQDAFGWRLGRLEAVGERSVYPLRAVTAECFATDRAVILGNAAHALHPVAGQGLNLALRDVAGLAEALGAAPPRHQNDPADGDTAGWNASPAPGLEGDAARESAPAPAITDPGNPAILAAYARARQSDYRRTFVFTDGLVRVFSNEFLPLVAARNIGLTALDLFPPARRQLLKQATGAAGDVPILCQ
ncbi:FAD-dependent monooxygenase [Spiribacter sp. 2438]|uniref:FAD-dependent monooxygenase n=1 Tax=Spiribacter sp. 2438 TaxID=2666185 RepID=UPI001E39F9FB|nr:FAD-dependent monooxygenase [Spiribacter sp. 2438]